MFEYVVVVGGWRAPTIGAEGIFPANGYLCRTCKTMLIYVCICRDIWHKTLLNLMGMLLVVAINL